MDNIDRQIAEKVMGWKHSNIATTFCPSTNIAHAFEVVGKFKNTADFFLTKHAHDILWEAGFSWEAEFSMEEGVYTAQADTPAMAICLAALETVKR